MHVSVVEAMRTEFRLQAKYQLIRARVCRLLYSGPPWVNTARHQWKRNTVNKVKCFGNGIETKQWQKYGENHFIMHVLCFTKFSLHVLSFHCRLFTKHLRLFTVISTKFPTNSKWIIIFGCRKKRIAKQNKYLNFCVINVWHNQNAASMRPREFVYLMVFDVRFKMCRNNVEISA